MQPQKETPKNVDVPFQPIKPAPPVLQPSKPTPQISSTPQNDKHESQAGSSPPKRLKSPKIPKAESVYALDAPRYRYCCCAAKVSALVFAFIILFYSLLFFGLVIWISVVLASMKSGPILIFASFILVPVLAFVGCGLVIGGHFAQIPLLYKIGGGVMVLYNLTCFVFAILSMARVAVPASITIPGMAVKAFPAFWICKLVMGTVFVFNIWRAYLQVRDDKALLKLKSSNPVAGDGVKPKAKPSDGTLLREFAALPPSDAASKDEGKPGAVLNTNGPAIPTVIV